MSDSDPPTSTPHSHRVVRPATWLKATLFYWFMLLVATHIPGSGETPPGLTIADKFMHFGAFTVLAAMVGWTYFRIKNHLTLRHLVILGLTMAAYGAVDEWTQLLVGRSCELLDWVGDVAGIVVGLSLAKWLVTKRGHPSSDTLA